MNKRINTSPQCFISIVGPGGCGKTQLVLQMLQKQRKIFKPFIDKSLCFYHHFQDPYQSLLLGASDDLKPFEIRQGLQWPAVDTCDAPKMRTLVVIDDLYQDAREYSVFVLSCRRTPSQSSLDDTEAEPLSTSKRFKKYRLERHANGTLQELSRF